MSDHIDDISEEELDEPTSSKMEFEEKLLKRVNKDFQEAADFLREERKTQLAVFRMYHNANQFDELRKSNLYPVPFMREQIDTFVASVMNPLWAKDEPCKLSPGPDADPKSIVAKQFMHEYQNREDGLKTTERILIEDIAINGYCAAKTDFVERSERLWTTVDVPVMQDVVVTNEFGEPAFNPDTLQPVTEKQPIIHPETNQPVTKPVSVQEDIITYRGPHTERIDPFDVYFGKDKRRDNNEPIMIRSFVRKSFFDDKEVFINQDKILDLGSSDAERYDDDSEASKTKREILIKQSGEAKSKKDHLYVEWQGELDKEELFKYLGESLVVDDVSDETIDEHDLGLVRDGEKIFAIVGIVDASVVVRIDVFPFKLNRSNIVLGIMQPQGNEIIGGSIGAKAMPAARQLNVLAGIMLLALKLSVNRGHAVNVNAISGELPDLNVPGYVLKTLENPALVHTLIDQPAVVQDIYTAIGLTSQWGKDETGQQDSSSAKADPNAETLGENEIIANKANIRASDPLEMIETTLIIEITKMRDEINQEFITQEYAVEVIGEEKARSWIKLTPAQIRSHTRFLCESSGREFNRAVVTQQTLQLTQLAPAIQQSGQAVRMDRLAAKVAIDGFGWSQEEAEEFLPDLKAEKDGDKDFLDRIKAEKTILSELVQKLVLESQLVAGGQLNALLGGGGGGGGGNGSSAPSPGQQLPQPTSERGALDGLEQRNQTQVGAL